MCDVKAAQATETYEVHEDLLGGFEVPLDLAVHRVDHHDAVIGENVEHVSHAEAWRGHRMVTPLPGASLQKRSGATWNMHGTSDVDTCAAGTQCNAWPGQGKVGQQEA